MAAALPIVASRVGGIPSLIEDGINGFLVEPGNASQIAQMVLMILRDPEVSLRMSKANKRKVQLYGWERAARDLEKAYLACLNT
jgi:glycosyltransferase involved in cell wall biosynthesis